MTQVAACMKKKSCKFHELNTIGAVPSFGCNLKTISITEEGKCLSFESAYLVKKNDSEKESD